MRSPSWIARLGLGRVEGQSERGEGGGEGRGARFVNPQPGPDLAARIQNGDLITNSGFSTTQNRLPAG